MKKTLILSIIALFAFTTFISCDDDEDDNKDKKPVITVKELGHDNTKIGHIGEDFHMDIEIVAENKIQKIHVELHPENPVGTDYWEFDSLYTGIYSGVKNTDFHEHIEIDSTAAEGDYHFHFLVTDMEGNTAKVEEEVKLEKE